MAPEIHPAECSCFIYAVNRHGDASLSFCGWANSKPGSTSWLWNDPDEAVPELTSHVKAALRFQAAGYKAVQGERIRATAKRLAGA